jgi:hypothetical protein
VTVAVAGAGTLAEVAVDEGAFAVSGWIDGSEAYVTMRGHADTRHKAALDRFLGALAAEATRLHLRRVRFDLSKVEFLSSSCLKGFVNWIGEVQGLPSERQYRIAFIADPAAQWQRRTVQALLVIGGDLIELSG